MPAATTVTAADHLAEARRDPGRAGVLDVLVVIDVDPDAAAITNWNDDLALWAPAPPPRRVVSIVAPELTEDQLLGLSRWPTPSALPIYVARVHRPR